MSLTSIFQDIADAIRSKTGKSESIYPSDMASEIEGISSGTQNITFNTTQTNKIKLKIEFKESEE
jgi:hypothetical protein